VSTAKEQRSRRLAHALRHGPAIYGITLDSGGWASLPEVVDALELTREELRAIVDTPGRVRFELVDDRIRALHGHSVAVELDHPAEVPPALLFHGSVAKNLDAIRAEGLCAQSRQFVHLTSSRDEAIVIGRRRGTPFVIEVRALALHEMRGTSFLHVTGSTIWLVEHIPSEYLVVP
jgi:putative RNA 2'-phosphotransferase